MTYFKAYFSTQTLFFLSFLSIGVFVFASCKGQAIAQDIPALTDIPLEPVSHYLTMSAYSDAAVLDRASLDEITFPDKKNVFLIKMFSPEYLTREEIETLALQLKPPANSSEQTRAELEFLLEIQESRTEAEVNEALRLHDIGYFPVIGMKNTDALFFEASEVMGRKVDPSKYPATNTLLHNIMKEMRITEFTAKNHFLRARPRQLESRLTPLKKMKSSSYASGHTLWAYMHAYILAELFPSKRDAFLQLAFDIGYSREILGVHYPSDEEASRVLAHTLLKNMWTKANFKRDFAAAKKEWSNK